MAGSLLQEQSVWSPGDGETPLFSGASIPRHGLYTRRAGRNVGSH